MYIYIYIYIYSYILPVPFGNEVTLVFCDVSFVPTPFRPAFVCLQECVNIPKENYSLSKDFFADSPDTVCSPKTTQP